MFTPKNSPPQGGKEIKDTRGGEGKGEGKKESYRERVKDKRKVWLGKDGEGGKVGREVDR